MSNLYTASNYKNTIISLLLKNKDFVKLMNPQESPHKNILTEDMLLGGTWFFDGTEYEEQGQVFDHNFVDETTTEEKTFVFVETDIDSIYQEDILIDFNLYVCVFTHKSLVKITNHTIPTINEIEGMGYEVGYYGNRVDILCDIIDGILNGNKKIKGIGDVKPARRGFCTIYSPNNKYYGKCLKYTISNLSETGDDCGN